MSVGKDTRRVAVPRKNSLAWNIDILDRRSSRKFLLRAAGRTGFVSIDWRKGTHCRQVRPTGAARLSAQHDTYRHRLVPGT